MICIDCKKQVDVPILKALVQLDLCIDCKNYRLNNYPLIKASLDGNLLLLKRCQELAVQDALGRHKAIKNISGLYAYTNMLLDGDPESEKPEKLLEYFNNEFKNMLKEDHNCQEYGCPVCDYNDG